MNSQDTLDLSIGVKKFRERFVEAMQLLKPPPKLTVSEWADAERLITAGNAEPGPWRTARVPYTKEPMDVCADPKVKQVSLMWGAQTGKTESCCNNVIGYYIAHDPKSIMVMHPTRTDVDTWCEGKLNPLINDTPAVTARVTPPRSREGGARAMRHQGRKGRLGDSPLGGAVEGRTRNRGRRHGAQGSSPAAHA